MSPAIFLAYGKVADPGTALAREGATLPEGLGRQVARIGPATPAFRLNTPGWIAPSPSLMAALDTRAALRTLIRDRLEAAIPAFAPRVRDLIRAYLDAIEGRTGPATDPTDTLTAPGDRVFAALLPLPCPQILLPGEPPAWVQADLAFWDGTRLTAIRLSPEAALLPRQRRLAERLAHHLGPRFRWHHDPSEPLPADVLAACDTAPAPIFGPCRAPALHQPLPDLPEP